LYRAAFTGIKAPINSVSVMPPGSPAGGVPSTPRIQNSFRCSRRLLVRSQSCLTASIVGDRFVMATPAGPGEDQSEWRRNCKAAAWRRQSIGIQAEQDLAQGYFG